MKNSFINSLKLLKKTKELKDGLFLKLKFIKTNNFNLVIL